MSKGKQTEAVDNTYFEEASIRDVVTGDAVVIRGGVSGVVSDISLSRSSGLYRVCFEEGAGCLGLLGDTVQIIRG